MPAVTAPKSLARTQLIATLRALMRNVRLRPLGARPERTVLRATILVPRRSGLVRLSARSGQPAGYRDRGPTAWGAR